MRAILFGAALVAMANGGSLAFPLEGMLLILASAGAWAVYAVVGRRASDEDATEVTAGALLAILRPAFVAAVIGAMMF